jgi:hypothetical protein
MTAAFGAENSCISVILMHVTDELITSRVSLPLNRTRPINAGVTIEYIVAEIDAEIQRLTAARDALIGGKTRKVAGKKHGRAWSAEARARQSQAMKA